MNKWKVKYTINSSSRDKVEKTTDVYGVNQFDAYCTANKLLSILERGKTIDKITVESIG
jgi:hypothetical protein